MKIVPTSDHIVACVKVKSDLEEKLIGKLIIPNTVEDKEPLKATVIAVGPGALSEGDRMGGRHDMQVKIGDTILIGKYTGTELTYEHIKYVVLREEDVLAILRPED